MNGGIHMTTTTRYDSPLGTMLLAADSEGLTGLWFEGAKRFAQGLDGTCRAGETPVLTETKRWLEQYFQGRRPETCPPLRPMGTAFQRAVWRMLFEIPYGQTTTYGTIAQRLARQRGNSRLSAQAVGGAVSRNPISILIPCHRVLGADGRLTGYAGGLERKAALLALERRGVGRETDGDEQKT